MTNSSGRIIFSTETLESLVSSLSEEMTNITSSDEEESPYNGEESENRLELFPGSSSVTLPTFINNTNDHLNTTLITTDGSQESAGIIDDIHIRSSRESLQSQVYTIAIVFGLLYFILILLLMALAFYIWRLHKMLARNRMKHNATFRSNAGFLSYDNGAYQDAYVQQENERGVDLPMNQNRQTTEINGTGSRGEVYRISVDDSRDFEQPDFDESGTGSDLSTGSKQRNISRILGHHNQEYYPEDHYRNHQEDQY